jgi:hypothetical protein
MQHASKLAAHKKNVYFKTVYILRALEACWGLEVRERASNGQISIWARTCRWCCGLYQGGMLHLSGLYIPISWVHEQGDYGGLNRGRAEKK